MKMSNYKTDGRSYAIIVVTDDHMHMAWKRKDGKVVEYYSIEELKSLGLGHLRYIPCHDRIISNFEYIRDCTFFDF